MILLVTDSASKIKNANKMQPDNTPNQDQFSQVAERIRSANNVLVTVSNNPSVDQLSACIGLTLALNKLNKHATAVFSGEPPSTLEFLKPENTLEKNTDSLRDFIISLDKAKADKLRYKVEDNVVKIFITPYKTSISEKDFDFSQGDFNVDAVVAIGVKEKNDLDKAIVSHGRILHDATVISVNTLPGSELGSINWLDSSASSLSEMISDLVAEIGADLLDAQIATAFLTGIVAETDRFRNERSNPHTMSVAGTLMSAGASTQLIASKLEEPPAPPQEMTETNAETAQNNEDGTIEIDHSNDPPPALDDNIKIDESGTLQPLSEEVPSSDEVIDEAPKSEAVNHDSPSIISEPPRLGGQLTANSIPEYQQYTGSTDPLSAPTPSNNQILSRDPLPEPKEVTPPEEPIISEFNTPDASDKTLSEIEEAVDSPHTRAEPVEPQPPTLQAIENAYVPPPAPENARDAVQRAVAAVDEYKPEPIEALGANPVNLDLGHEEKSDGSEENNHSSAPIGPPPPVPPPMTPPGV